MSISATIRKTSSVGGVLFSQSSTPSAEAAIVHVMSVSPGFTGSLTTRTDDDTGVITVEDSGHAFELDDRVDIYWVGGCRRGMGVTNVEVNAITIDGGDGDNLPTQGTAVTLVEPERVYVPLSGSLIQTLLLVTTERGQFTFTDVSDNELYHVELGADFAWDWVEGYGLDNPLEGDTIDSVYVSHDGAAAATMKIGILHDEA